MQLHDLGLAALAFLSELLGTLSGFGSSTFFVPAAQLIEQFYFLLALTSLLHCFSNAAKIFFFRKHFRWRLFWQMAGPAILLTGAGALLTSLVAISFLKIGLGILLVALALFFLFGGRYMQQIPIWASMALSGISGFFTGLVGTGGAIRGAALAALQLEKNTFVGLSAAIDFGGDFLRLFVYLWSGYMDWSQWFYLPLLGVAAIGGTKAGQILLAYVSQKQFEKIVAVFVFFSGIAMIVQAVSSVF